MVVCRHPFTVQCEMPAAHPRFIIERKKPTVISERKNQIMKLSLLDGMTIIRKRIFR